MQKLFDPIQRAASKLITNCFKTVSAEAGAAEAGILPTALRLVRRISKFWVDSHTLPKSNPIWEYLDKAKSMRIKTRSIHRAPTMLMRMHVPCLVQDIETIEAFTIAPWQNWLSKIIRIVPDRDRAARECLNARGTVRKLAN